MAHEDLGQLNMFNSKVLAFFHGDMVNSILTDI